MKYLIKNCKLIAPGNRLHGKRVDILIQKGIIADIKSRIKAGNEKVIQGKDLHVSAGWIDIGTHLGEPGYEQRETVQTLASAAHAGGYTDIVTMPDSDPPIETRSQVRSLIEEFSRAGLDVRPLAALSKHLSNENIAELIDLHRAGAVGFTDGLRSTPSPGLLMRALQYAKGFDGRVIVHACDDTLANGHMIHEGDVSIHLGMKGTPCMAEHIATYQAIQVAKYTGGRLCLHLLTAGESATLLDNSDDRVTAGVSYLNLVKTDDDLNGFDANLKVKPVIRSSQDRDALLRAVKSRKIKYISSNHQPLEVEHKMLEYAYAEHGAIGLETVFSALVTDGRLGLEDIIYGLTEGPREVLGIASPIISKGADARLTIFDPSVEWRYEKADIRSKSANSPFIGTEFTGKVIATLANGKLNQP